MDKKTVYYNYKEQKCITRVITFMCNNHCISCITDRKEHAQQKDMTTDELKALFSQYDPKTDVFDLNGGEPTCRNDLFEILAFIRSNYPNSLIQLLTNARRFSNTKYINSFMKSFFENNLAPINFFTALYGPTARIHDSITRAPGSFNQTTKGLSNLHDNKQSIEIRIILQKFNYEHLEETLALVNDKYPEVNKVTLINLKISGDAAINKKAILVPYSKIVPNVIKGIDKFSNKLNIRLYHFPKCIIPKQYQQYAEGLTMPKDQAYFAPSCTTCKEYENCSGLWKGYEEYYGHEELKPIKENSE